MRLVIGTALALGVALVAPGARAASDQGSGNDQVAQSVVGPKSSSKVTHRKTQTTTEETEVQPAQQGSDQTAPSDQATPSDQTPPTDQPATTGPDTGEKPGTIENPNPPEQGGFGPGNEPMTPTTPPSGETRVETPSGETTTQEAPYMSPTAVRADRDRGPGFSITAGGGVFGFTEKAARDATTDVGGMYTARLGLGTRRIIGLEVGYIGSAQNINALGVQSNAVLLSNGVEGLLRLNGGAGMVQPYVVGGAAWRRYDVTNTSINTSDLRDSDNVAEFPVGAGVDFRLSGLIIDARGEYRFSTSNDLFRVGGPSNLNNWQATLKAGVEF